MTTLQAPWTSRSARARAARRHRRASLAVVLLFVMAAAAVTWQLVGAAGDGAGSSAPQPQSPAAPAVPADDAGSGDPPAADDPVTPSLPAPSRPEEPAAAEPAVPDATEPEPTEPEPTEPDEPQEAPDGGTTAPDDGTEVSEEDAAPQPPAVDLVAVQRQLQELGYLLGPADGAKGQQTIAAVMAFQRVNGLAVDGIVGPMTLGALEAPAAPELRGGPATRIEVDLTNQLAHVVRDGIRVVTLQVSSGNGEAYPSASGGTAYARTPVGAFQVVRRVHGVRESRLGTMFDPLYFHNGFAIHGSNSVPPYPASHGCIRVTRADGRWLIANIADGTPVHLYGGTHVFTPGS